MQKTKAELLLEKIKEHNNAYRAGITLVSDKEYDAEVEELRKLDPNNEWFHHIEPAPVGDARKVKLPIPMKSLNKVKCIDDIQNWVSSLGVPEDSQIIVTPKLDGLSLLHDEASGMTYSRGGSDNEGQNCTAHYKAAQIFDTPTKLAFTYGEFVFSRNSWEMNFAGRTSPDTGDKYKSPRNTAAGLLNRDQPTDNLKFVDFFRYGTDEASLKKFDSYGELFNYMCQKFDQQFLYECIKANELNDEKLIELYNQWNREYYIDGLVLYINDLSVWERVGRQETTGNPNYAIAYKNPAFTETFETTVRGISWKASKAGALKPVVNIDTVDTGDCEMENPTGYNAKYIFDNEITEGAKIIVTRSGGVIPKILEVVKPADKTIFEEMGAEMCECPHCGAPTKWNDSKVELLCTNPNCSGVQLAKAVHFYATCGIENMGEETISKMFEAGYKSIRSMLNISFDELLTIEGFGEFLANIVLENNAKILKGIEVTKLMHASDCFTGIGQVKAKKILLDMDEGSRDMFVKGYQLPVSEEDIRESTKFKTANKTMQSFMLGINPFYRFVLDNGLTILPMEAPKEATSDKYANMRVCFTGVRDTELESQIVSGGGEVVNNVSKKTTHLIVADINSSSTKTAKARQLGIEILTIQDFKDKF